jgi:hypothetical protein
MARRWRSGQTEQPEVDAGGCDVFLRKELEDVHERLEDALGAHVHRPEADVQVSQHLAKHVDEDDAVHEHQPDGGAYLEN